MTKSNWHSMTRFSRFAAIMFPDLVGEPVRREMSELAANERKAPPQSAQLLADDKRGPISKLGGTATQQRRT